MPIHEKKRIECNFSIERGCAIAGVNCTAVGPYCEICGNRFEGREEVDGETAPTGIEEHVAAQGSEFADKREVVDMELYCCKRACHGQLQLPPCKLKQYPVLQHREEDLPNVIESTLTSRADRARDDDHTRSSVGFEA